ncbi:molybdopterin-dependent oxidoreductase [Sphingobacterium sp. E70]|uniref:molybdopterin-dependent oxidoreductase n=1 Tax=Sphingobacterium sp. E70 TaxID=2853439 RepID=UPI00211CFAFB|nr:molybdopterin-dependent oxidoreductase [Sphingobacterium sp. E70]
MPEAGLMGFHNPQQVNGIIGKGVSLADLYLPVKINGDMALLKALELILLDLEAKNPGLVVHSDFINNKTTGYTDFLAQFSKADYNLEHLSQLSGIAIPDMQKAAELLAYRNKIIFCWGMGLTQQPNGVDMIREILNILLMKGSIGIKGGGVCPVRGHSNVQGNRTMLIDEKPTDEQLDRLQQYFGFDPPREHGYDVVRAIKAMHAEKSNSCFAWAGIFVRHTRHNIYGKCASEAEFIGRCVHKIKPWPSDPWQRGAYSADLWTQ